MSSETKVAETKLKEMSRKAKEKGKVSTPKTKNEPPTFHQNDGFLVE